MMTPCVFIRRYCDIAALASTLAPPTDEIAAAFKTFDAPVRKLLLSLRELIYEIAEEAPQIGRVSEMLKWGQPSYAPTKPRIGSSIRLGTSNNAAGQCALFFICHTNLVDQFREIYAETLRFEGNRAIVINPAGTLPREPLKHCITMALTYHLNKQAGLS
jgi:uncharacterized protein DUF1801